MPRQDATRWRPDTCSCELYIRVDALGQAVYLDDGAVRAEHQARIAAGDPTAAAVLAPPAVLCPEHAALGQALGPGLAAVILGEQDRRNRAIAVVAGVIRPLYLNLTDEDFEPFLRRAVAWRYDAQRVLEVSLPGLALAPAQRAAIRNGFDAAFGVGKARLA